MKKIFIIIITLLATAAFINAQQDAMYTHYMRNTITVNPAYAGSRDALSLAFVNRLQWIGIDGAPNTQTFSAHSPIGFYNSSVGLSFTNDNIGVTNRQSFYADYSYKLRITKNSNLYMGLKGGFDRSSDNLNEIVTGNNGDATFSGNGTNKLMPNFGLGVYYLTKSYYVGASIPRLLQYDNNNGAVTNSFAGLKQHYFIIAGAILNINNNFKFKPTTLLKATEGAPLEMDLTASFIYKDKFWGGAMYRTNDAIGVLAGFYLTNQFALGYSFDWSYNKINRMTSHEILLTYDFDFSKDKHKMLSPRFF